MSIILATLAAASPAADARTLFYNASVTHTMSGTTGVTAWCVDNASGRFLSVGGYQEAAGACGTSARSDLQGAVVIPGMIDSHLHLLYGGYKLARPQLDNCSSPAEVVALLQAYVAAHPLLEGSWLQGMGWDQERFPGKKFPTRQDLDGTFPHTPIWLGRIDGHAAWVNSEALRRAPPLPATDPTGGRIVRDAKGQPTGVLTDTAMPLVADHIPPPTYDQASEALHLALTSLTQNGLTAIHDPGIGLGEVGLLQDAIDNGTFPIRSYAMYLANGGTSLGDHLANVSSPKVHNYKERLTVQASVTVM